MSEQTNTHPARDHLMKFFLGRLQGKEAHTVEDHVADCEICCKRLAELDGAEDDFLTALKSGPFDSRGCTSATSNSIKGAEQISGSSDSSTMENCVGPYKLIELLGTGGMGSVYKAWHVRLDRLVALKMLHVDRLNDPQAKIRFSMEAESVARLQHPNIIRLYDVGRYKDQPYFAMELVKGGSLSQAIANGLFGARRAAEIVRTLADAMHYAHERGVVHRDLKPENILLAETNSDQAESEAVLKIADFGIAKRLHSDFDLTQTGMMAGTPNYMAPEQIQGQSSQVGPRTDVYALGVILHELLTGNTPYSASTPLEVMNLILESAPPVPSIEGAALPPDLVSICLQCLHKESARRYASAQALADDLGRFLAGRTVAARRVGLVERSWKWSRRRPALTALLSVVALLAVVGFPAVSWLWFNTMHARDLAQQSDLGQRWSSYRINLLAAGSFLQLHNNTAARRALESAPEEHRNWEWRYYQQTLEGSGRKLTGLGGTVLAMAFRDDGKRLMTVSKEKLQLWEPQMGKLIVETTSQFQQEIKQDSIAFSPDGRFCVSPGPNDTVSIRDSESGKIVKVLQSRDGQVTACQYSSDGSLLLTFGKGTQCCSLWDTQTNTQLRRIEVDSPIECAAFSRGAEFLALTLESGAAGTWDVQSGRVLAQWDALQAASTAVLFSPNDTLLATSSEYPESMVRLWSVPDGKLVASMDSHTNGVYAIDFSPDGALLASASYDQTVRLWDGKNGQPLRHLPHGGSVFDIQFSPDGTLLASAAQDRAVRLWDTAEWELISLLQGFRGTVTNLEFNHTGSTLASASLDNSISLWDIEVYGRADYLRGHEDIVYDVAFSPNGEKLASAAWDGTFRIWDVSSGQEIFSLPATTQVASGVTFDPTGEKLAAVDRETLTIWNTSSGISLLKVDLPKGYHPDRRVTFSSNGRLVATGTLNGEVLLFDPTSGKLLATFNAHESACRDVAFSPDSRHLISAGHDFLCHAWDIQTSSRVATLRGHKSYVTSVDYNQSGTLIATCSSDGTVRIWNGKKFTLRSVLDHGVYVYDASFSPDNSRLAVACDDNFIRLWDVESGDMVAQLHGHKAYVHAVAFSPDGTRLVSASGDKTLRLWDTQSRMDRKRNSIVPTNGKRATNSTL